MSFRVKAVTLVAAIFLAAAHAAAQATAPPATVNVFLDCSYFCDQDYMRTEITYVNWVRDRADADVHILVTQQSTGGGGAEYTLAFLGLRGLAGVGDTMKYLAPQAASQDDSRKGLLQVIKMGLVPFLARTGLSTRVVVSIADPAKDDKQAQAQPAKDPWNYWTFTISGSGNTSGERSSSFSSISGGLTAKRTTNDWKVILSGRENYNESNFTFDDGTTETTTTSIRRSLSLNETAVKSLGPKLSAGLLSSIGSSTFDNKKFYYRFTPSVEYDLFPYSQSTRRMLTAQYSIGLEGNVYREETIYGKTTETNPTHSLSLNLSQSQPWGSVNIGLNGSQYLHDLSKNSASIFVGTNLRLIKGLSLSLSGDFSSIHDQLSLPRGDATKEEVLLRQRQLQSNYSYFAYASLNYTFGSIFNSVVNPRFGGGGGSFFFF